MAGINSTAYVAIIPNLCTCGHNYSSHTNPTQSNGQCSECRQSAFLSGGLGTTNHPFIPNNQTNNDAAALFPNRSVFSASDPNGMNVGATTQGNNFVISWGPARPPNGQRAG